jgi:hypothetical protein
MTRVNVTSRLKDTPPSSFGLVGHFASLAPRTYLPLAIVTATVTTSTSLATMANTKYQNVPQRDSFEEQDYAQPPPSYQAEASSHQPLMGGAPRSEDDNIPDDFKVRKPLCTSLLSAPQDTSS